MIEVKEKKILIGGKDVIIRFGEYAHQANGSVILQCGETVVHAVCTMGEENPDLDFFPLMVEYSEGLYAGGIIKSSRFIKREGKPSDETILRGRLIDRSIRPMFPKNFRREVQIVINVLASDKENPHDVLSLTAVVASLAVSDIPFDCHLGGIRISKVNGELVINPTYNECDAQDYELVLAGNEKKIIMIECAANCVSDDEILKGFEYSYKHLGEIANAMDEIQKEFGKPKAEYTEKDIPDEIIEKIRKLAEEKIEDFYIGLASKKINRNDFKTIVKEPVLELFTEKELEENKKAALEALDKIFKEKVRENILTKKRRVDGREIEEIREIEIWIDPLPQVHGSSMFQRGETQVLNILTLGAPGGEQLLESIEGETKKRYIHHYNAPPYSVGEVGRVGFPGRREIGHGALAEKALKPVIPQQSDFPYVIRLVSEVMGQNGSSSMASTCASSITLMAGGVPIKEPVAGISVGLITGEKDNDFVTLTDIQGVEDFFGDMDFKVAGTRETITAIQMDTKIKGLTFEIVSSAIHQAKRARQKLLDKIFEIVPEPRNEISIYAPRIDSIKIPTDTIGKVLGSGGKNVKQLISDYNVEINIDDDGNVNIASASKESIDSVKRIINGMVTDPIQGETYKGKVVRMQDFGAFVEIFPGKDGLLHISKISKERVNDIHDVLEMGQIVEVKLINIDSQGRLNFAMADLDIDFSAEADNQKRRSVESRPRNRRY